MQKTSISICHMPIRMDEQFPINAPYIQRLHTPDIKSASSLHWHDTLEIGLCRRGSGLFYIGNRVYPFQAGDISVVMPGVPHIAQSDRTFVSGWQFIDMDLKTLAYGEIDEEALRLSGILRAERHGAVVETVEGLLRELSAPDAFSRQSIRALATLLHVQLARCNRESPADEPPAPEALREISPAVVYISRHYDQPVTVAHIAALCNCSVTAFRRMFEEAMGVAPFEFLYTVRIRAAMNLLTGTRLNVSEVAQRVGYSSLSSFNRHFLRMAGCAPSEFRKQRENAQEG